MMKTLNINSLKIYRYLDPRYSPTLNRRSNYVYTRRRAINPKNSNCRDMKFSKDELDGLNEAVASKNDLDDVLQVIAKLESPDVLLDCDNLCLLMVLYAQNGFFSEAQGLWGEIVNSSFVPSIQVVSNLVEAYARFGQFEEVWRIVRETDRHGFGIGAEVYSVAVSCFGQVGQLGLMEAAMKEMVSRGFKVDSVSGNAFVKYYSIYGSLDDMEVAYQRLKKSRILIEKEVIRAVASAYIRERKFYRFGEFLRDVGLGRRNVGNLLWNLLLLSYAANFKMKSLQREFVSMIESGFSPDLNTFNIRALAFARMSLFWDLHVSIDHMKHKAVDSDLVTFGCVVDAYLERRLGRNLSFVVDKMDAKRIAVVRTDPLVFQVFGKGDFHTNSEALLGFSKQKWTYEKLVAFHMRKQFRRNQIFWNY